MYFCFIFQIFLGIPGEKEERHFPDYDFIIWGMGKLLNAAQMMVYDIIVRGTWTMPGFIGSAKQWNHNISKISKFPSSCTSCPYGLCASPRLSDLHAHSLSTTITVCYLDYFFSSSQTHHPCLQRVLPEAPFHRRLQTTQHPLIPWHRIPSLPSKYMCSHKEMKVWLTESLTWDLTTLKPKCFIVNCEGSVVKSSRTTSDVARPS